MCLNASRASHVSGWVQCLWWKKGPGSRFTLDPVGFQQYYAIPALCLAHAWLQNESNLIQKPILRGAMVQSRYLIGPLGTEIGKWCLLAHRDTRRSNTGRQGWTNKQQLISYHTCKSPARCPLCLTMYSRETSQSSQLTLIQFLIPVKSFSLYNLRVYAGVCFSCSLLHSFYLSVLYISSTTSLTSPVSSCPPSLWRSPRLEALLRKWRGQIYMCDVQNWIMVHLFNVIGLEKHCNLWLENPDLTWEKCKCAAEEPLG